MRLQISDYQNFVRGILDNVDKTFQAIVRQPPMFIPKQVINPPPLMYQPIASPIPFVQPAASPPPLMYQLIASPIPFVQPAASPPPLMYQPFIQPVSSPVPFVQPTIQVDPSRLSAGRTTKTNKFYTVKELKRIAAILGLSTSGNKEQLVQKIRQAL